MTAAHNFQDDNEKNETTHSILSGARFEVKFEIDGQTYDFGKQRRMAFIQQGGYTDIAMVKLGVQWARGRREADYSESWEGREATDLANMRLPGLPENAVADIRPHQPENDETMYVTHYGGAGDQKKFEERRFTQHGQLGASPAEASGCRILFKRGPGGEYRLVGLYFSVGEAEAVLWSKDINSIYRQVRRMERAVEFYMGIRILVSHFTSRRNEKDGVLYRDACDRARDERKDLMQCARNENFKIIYLCNGECINPHIPIN